jgi:NAD(P)-dependent dehydrogenase (short-subunit alcohol dehydrogenase family)
MPSMSLFNVIWGAVMPKILADKIALVAGATRGAGRGIAVELGAAGATVYVTGRSTGAQRSEYRQITQRPDCQTHCTALASGEQKPICEDCPTFA